MTPSNVSCPVCGGTGVLPEREPTVTRGRGVIEAVLAVTAPGEVVHYRDVTSRLKAAGYQIKSRKPSGVVLTAISRAPQFAAHGNRSGIYQRAPR